MWVKILYAFMLSLLVLSPPSTVPAADLGSGMTHCCANVFVSSCWPDGACQPSLLWLELVWVSFTPFSWAEAWEWLLHQQTGVSRPGAGGNLHSCDHCLMQSLLNIYIYFFGTSCSPFCLFSASLHAWVCSVALRNWWHCLCFTAQRSPASLLPALVASDLPPGGEEGEF